MVEKIASVESLGAKAESNDCGVLQNTEGVTTVEDSAEIELLLSKGCLQPMLFKCYSSKIADCSVVVERLLQRLPSGIRVLGLQIAFGAGNGYSYSILLWPPEGECSDCDAEKWRELADSKVDLDDTDKGVCIAPSTQGGRLLLYLLVAKQIARAEGDQTEWVGDVPSKKMFHEADWKSQRCVFCC